MAAPENHLIQTIVWPVLGALIYSASFSVSHLVSYAFKKTVTDEEDECFSLSSMMILHSL
jgi:hypothetical protein